MMKTSENGLQHWPLVSLDFNAAGLTLKDGVTPSTLVNKLNAGDVAACDWSKGRGAPLALTSPAPKQSAAPKPFLVFPPIDGLAPKPKPQVEADRAGRTG